LKSTHRWIPTSTCCCSCGSTSTLTFRAFAHDDANGGQVDIVECTACQFAWQFPVRRSAEDSSAVFSAAYTTPASTVTDYFDPDRRAHVAQLELEYVRSLPTSGRNMLDVGGGDGTFALHAAANGWQVTAVDPAIDASRIQASGLTVLKGTSEALPEGARFDVITLWDVIEHVEDPSSMLRGLISRIQDRGWLVIETGNYKCAGRVRAGMKHWIYQLDHRWYFAPDSLRALLASNGWEVQDISKRVLRPDWRGTEQARPPTLHSFAKACIRSPLNVRTHWRRHTALTEAASWLQSGMEIFCVAAQRMQ
jgi:2-polyprenyl-3-methyl-5-hydroxy-6-metoxy-1,4-benzoquinol methylase